jgi:uridine phosphorylase
VVEAVDAVGERLLGSAFHKAGNVTKDSLYAELDADAFLDLCRTENCRTTEMELSAIAVAAQENGANFGMISGVVGVLPDAPFAESEKAKGIAEQRSVRVATEAVKRLI